jgi:hypothetical protein
MYGQFGLEDISKSSLWEMTPKKTLMFEHYNLIDPMEWGATK